ncbi:hypothetical protein ASD02_26815 [Ensifer sp. Root1252]|nr:hypothetical protein ASD02_26815 [Ensifer sp. Root1252]KRC77714.1 hypothetical protein ASE32_29110 [Ensifer sp. Root231]KRC99558.1 hypothetical protein ASE47_27720 [Ensifer sp. Root258]
MALTTPLPHDDFVAAMAKGLSGAAASTKSARTVVKTAEEVPEITKAYKRPLGATTIGQRATVSIAYSPAAVQVGSVAQPFGYNDADLLISIPGYITTTSYEADGQTKSISYANGVTTTFSYSPTRRWLDRVTTAKGGTVLMDNQYGRDATGKIKTITGPTPDDHWVYDYNLRGRLVSADNLGNNAFDETYTFADNGNLTFRSRAANYVYPPGDGHRPHAPIAIGARVLSYDANGNMISRSIVTTSSRSTQYARVMRISLLPSGLSRCNFCESVSSKTCVNRAFAKDTLTPKPRHTLVDGSTTAAPRLAEKTQTIGRVKGVSGKRRRKPLRIIALQSGLWRKKALLTGALSRGTSRAMATYTIRLGVHGTRKPGSHPLRESVGFARKAKQSAPVGGLLLGDSGQAQLQFCGRG